MLSSVIGRWCTRSVTLFEKNERQCVDGVVGSFSDLGTTN